MKKLFVFLIGFLIVTLALALAYSLSNFLIVKNYGVVKAIGISIYEDAGCTVPLTEIDWGLVSPASSVPYEAWLKNEGSVVVTVTMSVAKWVPSEASEYMSLTWSCEGVSVSVDGTVSCIFTLEIFEDVAGITDFSFDILLVGSEV